MLVWWSHTILALTLYLVKVSNTAVSRPDYNRPSNQPSNYHYDLRKYSFPVCVVNIWNSLPNVVDSGWQQVSGRWGMPLPTLIPSCWLPPDRWHRPTHSGPCVCGTLLSSKVLILSKQWHLIKIINKIWESSSPMTWRLGGNVRKLTVKPARCWGSSTEQLYWMVLGLWDGGSYC